MGSARLAAALPARFRFHPFFTAASRAAFLIGIAANCGLPAASGAPVQVANRAALQAPSFTLANSESRAQLSAESSGTTAAPQSDSTASADSLWASHGDTPAPSHTTLRYAAPILASMCGAAPALCVPDDVPGVTAGVGQRPRGCACEREAGCFAAGIGSGVGIGRGGRIRLWRALHIVCRVEIFERAGHIEHDLRDALVQADLPADIVAQVEHLFAGRLDPAIAALP
jgi:hypothetical protein